MIRPGDLITIKNNRDSFSLWSVNGDIDFDRGDVCTGTISSDDVGLVITVCESKTKDSERNTYVEAFVVTSSSASGWIATELLAKKA